MTDTQHPLMRIAFRQSGVWVKCYFAMPDTMDDALFVGQVLKRALDQSPRVFDLFREMMEEVCKVIMAEHGKVVTGFEITDAPDNEREH